jgi:hypothetical protein
MVNLLGMQHQHRSRILMNTLFNVIMKERKFIAVNLPAPNSFALATATCASNNQQPTGVN